MRDPHEYIPLCDKNNANCFNAWIEIPKGSKVKYETDENGFLCVDRVLFSSMIYPHNYGFFPQTLGGDGDPLDVLVIMNDPVVPNCYLRVKPIGVLHMDDQGEPDEKIIGIHIDHPEFNHITDISELPSHRLVEISTFFRDYKKNENKIVEIKGWGSVNEAYDLIKHAHAKWSNKK